MGFEIASTNPVLESTIVMIVFLGRQFALAELVGGVVVVVPLAGLLILPAFYVDSGPHLPVWNRPPPVAYWTLPAAVAGQTNSARWRRTSIL